MHNNTMTSTHQAEFTDPTINAGSDDTVPFATLSGTAAFDAGQGDMPTWAELVEEHADSVYRLAYRLSGNQYDAEDLTQETFMRVFRSLKNYQPGTFEGW